jgi:phosphate/sulfate permease
VAAAASVKPDYLFVALAIAVGGALGAFRVAQTMSKKITPMDTREAITANLMAAAPDTRLIGAKYATSCCRGWLRCH